MQTRPSVIIVTGQSGSGKSVALAALEDGGFYCVDNLPPDLLESLVAIYLSGSIQASGLAISIDARSPEEALKQLPERIDQIRERHPEISLRSLYLESSEDRLVARFSETRRRHPLSYQIDNLIEAIRREATLLTELRQCADLVLDTSQTSVHQIRDDIRLRLLNQSEHGPSILIQSFAFKRGIPMDSDFLFDIRHLPNPHWDPDLRPLTGRDLEIVGFLERHPITHHTRTNLSNYLRDTLTQLSRTDRSYVTCSVGCTGGKHRSVYMVERLGEDLKPAFRNLVVRHRDLGTE